MQLNPLPKVICSLHTWKGDDDKSSVVENELLVLKQVCGNRCTQTPQGGVASIFISGIFNWRVRSLLAIQGGWVGEEYIILY